MLLVLMCDSKSEKCWKSGVPGRYAEAHAKPVVSDFDTFTLRSRSSGHRGRDACCDSAFVALDFLRHALQPAAP